MQNLWKRVFPWKNHGRKRALPCDSGCAASLGADVALGETTRALWAEFLWTLGTDRDPTGDSGCPGPVYKSLEIYSCLCMNCPSQRHPEGMHSKLLPSSLIMSCIDEFKGVQNCILLYCILSELFSLLSSGALFILFKMKALHILA